MGQIASMSLHGLASSMNIHYEPTPNTCPICHTSILPKVLFAIHRASSDKEYGEVQIAFQCPHCEGMFIAIYQVCIETYGGDNLQREYHKLNDLVPKTAKNTEFSEEINNISSSFVRIYNQSISAESLNLVDIAGTGLRKSLEFLVKDFSIHNNPGKEDEIKKELLGSCIKKYITDEHVKACAERAVWLGNDETHYYRKWIDKDIEDLKRLIRLTVNGIENVLLEKQYIQDMPH